MQQNLYRFIAWLSQCHHCRHRFSWTHVVHGGAVRISKPTATWLFRLRHLFVILWLSHYNDSVTLQTSLTPLKVRFTQIYGAGLVNLINFFPLKTIHRSDYNQKLEATSTRQNHRQHIDICQWDSRRIDLKCHIKNYNNTNEAHAAGWNKRQTAEAVDPTVSLRIAIDWMSIRWGKLLKHFSVFSRISNFHISTKWEIVEIENLLRSCF